MHRLAIVFAVTLAIGQQAPDFTLRDQNGKAVSLSAAHGRKVVLVFYRGYW
jgi:peroxiredoxin